MAVQVINPVDTEFPTSPSTVEADTATEEEFEWVSLLCCTYGTHFTHMDVDWKEDIDV